jgi:hypothetical protein
MNHSTIYVGNTSVAEVSGLEDHDGVVQTDASVTMTALVDRRTGEAVSGVSLPLTLNHIAAGTYQGVISNAVAIVAERWYEATFVAVSSAGYRAEWVEKVRATARHG